MLPKASVNHFAFLCLINVKPGGLNIASGSKYKSNNPDRNSYEIKYSNFITIVKLRSRQGS